MSHPGPSFRAAVLTVLSGTLGGALFHGLDLPAAWLSGGMIAVAALALARVPLAMPDRLRDAAFIVIGISMGTGVTPTALSDATRWPLSLAGLALSIPAIIVVGLGFLVRIGRWDRATAFFAVVPGALSFVMAAALESKADPRLVALAQSIRLFMLIALLPPLIAAGAPAAHVAPLPVSPALLPGPAGLAALLAAGSLAGLIAGRGGSPVGLMFGAMAASAALHAFGIVSGPLPGAILVPALIVLGCMIGLRFEGASLGLVRRALAPSCGALAATLLVAGMFALLVAWALGLPLGQVLLAFAPGGLEAMVLLAFMLGVDPVYVGIHHIVRFVGLSLALPFVVRPFLKAARDAPPS